MRRLLLAGNNLAAILVLDLAAEILPAENILVVTPPGDQRRSWAPSLLEHAKTLGIRHIDPADVNAAATLDELVGHVPDLFLSVYYTQLLSAQTIDAFSCPIVNFHPALLPRRRGTAPLIWAIVEGDAETGLTVHHIDRGVDTGPVIAQYQMPIHPRDTGYRLHLKMARLVRAAAAELLRAWVAGASIPAGAPQTGTASQHSSRDPSVNHVDWEWDGERIRNVVRALAPPLPGAFARLEDGRDLVLVRVEPFGAGRERSHVPGMIELRRGDAPVVWAADGPVRIEEVLHDGRVLAGADITPALGLQEGQLLS